MRDVAILSILISFIPITFYRPWLGLLALVVIGYLHPQGYAENFMQNVPAYKLQLGLLLLSIVYHREFSLPQFDWRIAGLGALALLFLLTTINSLVPGYAWPKFWEVAKIFVPLVLMLLLINTQDKLFYLIITTALCFALLAIKGGFWAVMTGFSDRVYGPPGSHFYGNNEFAIATVMNLPLLVLWLRETTDGRMRSILYLVIFLSVAAALSSWSRGALLSLFATGALLILFSKRKMFLIAPLLVGAIYFMGTLEDSWFERMGTIAAYQEEKSASSRLETWQIGVESVQNRLLTGGGFDSWRFYTDKSTAMDWHNAYIEILVEHGVVTAAVWVALLLGSLYSLLNIWWRKRGINHDQRNANCASMVFCSFVAYMVGAIFLGITYWDLFYQMIVVSILIRRFSLSQNDSELSDTRDGMFKEGVADIR